MQLLKFSSPNNCLKVTKVFSYEIKLISRVFKANNLLNLLQ